MEGQTQKESAQRKIQRCKYKKTQKGRQSQSDVEWQREGNTEKERSTFRENMKGERSSEEKTGKTGDGKNYGDTKGEHNMVGQIVTV